MVRILSPMRKRGRGSVNCRELFHATVNMYHMELHIPDITEIGAGCCPLFPWYTWKIMNSQSIYKQQHKTLNGELRMVKSNGFIALYRQIREHWIWEKDKPFSKVEAWIDLILEAGYKDQRREYKGNFYEVRRGQLLYSLRYLANRWNWSKNKVDRFLSLLECDAMIEHRPGHHLGYLTICNYNRYNPSWDSKGDTNGTHKGQTRDKYNKRNNGNILNNNKDIKGCVVEVLESSRFFNGIVSHKNFDEWLDNIIDEYHDIDICGEIRKAHIYLISSGKRYKKYQLFLSNWFKNRQKFDQTDNRKPEKKDVSNDYPIDLIETGT